MITRKDFEALAAILARHAASPQLVDAIAAWCLASNPAFSKPRFLNAIIDQRLDEVQRLDEDEMRR